MTTVGLLAERGFGFLGDRRWITQGSFPQVHQHGEHPARVAPSGGQAELVEHDGLAWGAIPWNSFFAPGALLAAGLIVAVTEGVPGLRSVGARLVRWRVNWVWYALAIAVPLLVHVTAVLVNLALGATAPNLGLLDPWYGLPLALGMHIVSPLGGPLMEEPSFRGFAQPDLQRNRSRLAATAILALAITGWYAPLFFMPVFMAHPIGFVTTVAVTFWYAWLFNHASASSLLTLIAHGVEGGVETTGFWTPGADMERLNWTYALAWCVVALILLVLDRRFWMVGGTPDPGSTGTSPPAGADGSRALLIARRTPR